MSSHGAIDSAVLDQMCKDTGGDGVFVIEIIDEYMTDARAQLVAFAEALRAQDAKSARDAAHSLKGTSASVGAQGLADVAMAAEQACQVGLITEAAEFIPRLEAAFAVVSSALIAEKNRFGAGE